PLRSARRGPRPGAGRAASPAAPKLLAGKGALAADLAAPLLGRVAWMAAAPMGRSTRHALSDAALLAGTQRCRLFAHGSEHGSPGPDSRPAAAKHASQTGADSPGLFRYYGVARRCPRRFSCPGDMAGGEVPLDEPRGGAALGAAAGRL